MEKIIYAVRKHGAVKTNTKEEALKIVELAEKYEYTFKARKEGWSWIVQDMDN